MQVNEVSRYMSLAARVISSSSSGGRCFCENHHHSQTAVTSSHLTCWWHLPFICTPVQYIHHSPTHNESFRYPLYLTAYCATNVAVVIMAVKLVQREYISLARLTYEGPVTLELRPPRLPHAQKKMLIAPNRGESVAI